MFQTPIISVAIGLCFAFGAVALIASTLNEALAGLLKLRGRVLLDGLKELLNRNEGLLTALYTHALINPRDQASAAPAATNPAPAATTPPTWLQHDGIWAVLRGWIAGDLPFSQVPSYIPSKSFTVALIDAIGATQRNFASIGDAIAQIDDPQLGALLKTLYLRAEGNIDHFEGAVADWFDHAMDRVSGAYKRRAQLFTFIFGLFVAVAMNVDAAHVASTLWKQPVVQAPNVQHVPADAASAIEGLAQLPIGWTPAANADAALPVRFAGWLITAFAAVFGAPFWFDLLQRVTQLRSTGPKPDKNTLTITDKTAARV